jgi:quinol monooxygenase YgiN
MICVLASITVKPEFKAEYIELFKANVPAVLAEDGCIEYAPMVDADTDIPPQATDASVVTIVEKWESITHLKAHFQAPHMLAYKEKCKDMVVDVSLKILEEG